MSTRTAGSKFKIALLITMMLMLAMPFAHADDTGHIGSKPPNADGDGVPNNADPDFAYGSRNGEQNVVGDGVQGDDPASDGGDGIPNGGPIEGTGHKGKGIIDSLVSTMIFYWYTL